MLLCPGCLQKVPVITMLGESPGLPCLANFSGYLRTTYMSTNALAMIVSLNTIFYYCINWCSGERSYEPSKFHNRVERIPIDDHNVPRLRLESDSSPVVSLYLSLVARDMRWKGGKRGRESLPLFSLLITPAPNSCMLREKTTGDKLGLE